MARLRAQWEPFNCCTWIRISSNGESFIKGHSPVQFEMQHAHYCSPESVRYHAQRSIWSVNRSMGMRSGAVKREQLSILIRHIELASVDVFFLTTLCQLCVLLTVTILDIIRRLVSYLKNTTFRRLDAVSVFRRSILT
jgi:hypothetical protein